MTEAELATPFQEEAILHLYNQPLLASSEVADYLRTLAGQRFRTPPMAMLGAAWPGGKPYAFQDGIATLSVRGVLLHRSYYYHSLATGYDALRTLHDAALADPDVEGIVWDFSSGGGMVSGLFDFADELYRARGKKPAIALVNEHAYSAAYALASAVGNIHLTRTSGVGSIGALAVLWNFAGALDKEGIRVEVIRSAARKAKPNAVEPIEDKDRARLQADIDHAANLFIALVARNTGVDEATIRGTEAATLRAEEAVEIGLAHRIASVDEALHSFRARVLGSATGRPGPGAPKSMAAAPPFPGAGVSRASVGTERLTDIEAEVARARAEGYADGVKAENVRVVGILSLAEASGREEAAIALAKKPGLSIEGAREILAAVPLESSQGGEESLGFWMQATGGGANVAGSESVEVDDGMVARLDYGFPR